jgi:hypothetical protein
LISWDILWDYLGLIDLSLLVGGFISKHLFQIVFPRSESHHLKPFTKALVLMGWKKTLNPTGPLNKAKHMPILWYFDYLDPIWPSGSSCGAAVRSSKVTIVQLSMGELNNGYKTVNHIDHI